MTLERARSVADAVLFEGYLLYPYRASALKNQMRWQFGVLAPNTPEVTEPWFARTEVLVESDGDPTLHIRERFLHVQARESATADGHGGRSDSETFPGGPEVDDASVRELDASVRPREIPGSYQIPFRVDGDDETRDGVSYRSETLTAVLRIDVEKVPDRAELFRVAITVENHTAWTPEQPIERTGVSAAQRQRMLRHCLVSAHTLLSVQDGRFVSLLEPPRWAQSAANACTNVHTWPVLVGESGQRDVMLSSPIILYDYPAVAPESPGDLFDAAEIDEILTLRTLTLTDAEKRDARATDQRAAAIIDRSENLSSEAMQRLHGCAQLVHPPEVPEQEST